MKKLFFFFLIPEQFSAIGLENLFIVTGQH